MAEAATRVEAGTLAEAGTSAALPRVAVTLEDLAAAAGTLAVRLAAGIRDSVLQLRADFIKAVFLNQVWGSMGLQCLRAAHTLRRAWDTRRSRRR